MNVKVSRGYTEDGAKRRTDCARNVRRRNRQRSACRLDPERSSTPYYSYACMAGARDAQSDRFDVIWLLQQPSCSLR